MTCVSIATTPVITKRDVADIYIYLRYLPKTRLQKQNSYKSKEG